jgi:hypothetical protein
MLAFAWISKFAESHSRAGSPWENALGEALYSLRAIDETRADQLPG